MNNHLKALASLALATAIASHAQKASSTSGEASTGMAKKTHHAKRLAKPSIESQIESLRQDMQAEQSQIESLRQQLADRDAQLQRAQQAAQDAQAAAQQAQQSLQMQMQQQTDTTQSVGSLQSAVADLKSNTATIVTSMQDQQAATKKAIENPDVLHFKGITLSPTGSFVEAATVNRSKATGSDINTPFSAIPFDGANLAHLSEFYGTGRQSRLALTAEGKVPNGVIRGYYEMDWLGTGITSNNNQSNSYAMRQRQLWAQAQLNNGWTFTGGQMWSLVTETRKGLQNKSEVLPPTIDPAYNVGYVWTRQYGFRVTKDLGQKMFFGVSLEDAQTLPPSCAATGLNAAGTAKLACPANYVLGTTGNGGGLYNPTANYSSNRAPDVIVKLAFEPGFGHYEVFGVGRFFRDRVYPTAAGSAIGAYNSSKFGGGIGGGFRLPVAKNRLEVALHGLYGQGIGRYGTSTLADSTIAPDGTLALLHGFSALGELVAHPTPRLDVYADYGTDYAGRRYFREANGIIGYGVPDADNSGCSTEPLPGGAFAPASPAGCTGLTKNTAEPTFGYWYDFYKGSHGRLRQGLQYSYVIRKLWGSSLGGSPQATNNMIETSLRYYMP